jgi:hypothetical protein
LKINHTKRYFSSFIIITSLDDSVLNLKMQESKLLKYSFILEHITSFLTYQETINKFSLVSKLTNNLLKELEFFHLHNNLIIKFTKENLKNNNLINNAFKNMYTLVNFYLITYKKQIIPEIQNMFYKKIANQDNNEPYYFKENDKKTLHIIDNWSKKMHLNINTYTYNKNNFVELYSGTYFDQKRNIGELTKEYFDQKRNIGELTKEYFDEFDPDNITEIETYSGQFINNKLNKSGKVTIDDLNSNTKLTYIGFFVDDVIIGKSTTIQETETEIITYDGEYLNGVKHGRGIFTQTNFHIREEIIINDFRCELKENEKYRYDGEFIERFKQGRGIEETPYYRFEGEFINDERDLTQKYILEIK